MCARKKKTLTNTPRINSLFFSFISYALQPREDHFIQLPSPPYRWTFIYYTFFTESLPFPSLSGSELQILLSTHILCNSVFTKFPCILPSAEEGSEAGRTAVHPRKGGLSHSFEWAQE